MNSPSEDKKQQNQLQNLRQISVNDEIITPDQIIHEMQHHESNSQDEIIKKSSEVLIIQSLFLQKAKELGLDEDLSASMVGVGLILSLITLPLVFHFL